MFDGKVYWQILDGTWDPEAFPDLEPHAKDLLTEVQSNMIPPQVKSRSSTITRHEHSYHWKRRRAGTASETSELSFTHHIVGAHHQLLAEVDASLRSAPCKLGFTPTAFSVMTDFQLLKAQGVYRVDKMRTIKLMPAQFK